MWNARLAEAQAGIQIAGKITSNLIYVHDTTLRAETKEELKTLLMKVKEKTENFGFQKTQHSEN